LLIALVLLFSACATVDAFLFDATPDGQPLAGQEAAVEQTAPVQEDVKPAADALNAEIVALRQKIAMERARLAEAEQQQSTVPEPEAAAPASQLWVKVSFRPGQTELEEQTRIVLAKVAAKYLALPRTKRLDVRGYSDGDESKASATGKSQIVQEFLSAQDLSAERADAVTRALVAAGIPDNIIQAQGFGASNVVDSSTSEDGRANNRRVEIYLID